MSKFDLAYRVTNSADIIDSRDVIERIRELESELEDQHNTEIETAANMGDSEDERPTVIADFEEWLTVEAEAGDPDAEELIALRALQDEAEGCSDWRHGASLIRDSYFETYARDVAEDLGYAKSDHHWPYTCIDWEKAARELQYDYTSVDYDGVTYWIRS